MKWNLKLNDEGFYWYQADLPRGRICDVEFPGKGNEWVANLYEPRSVDGLLIASDRSHEVCKEKAAEALRKLGLREAKEWARAVR